MNKYSLKNSSYTVLSISVMSDSLWPLGLSPVRFLYSWGFSRQVSGVGCHALPQGIFPTQGLNPGLPHCREVIYQLSHQGSPELLEWVAYSFSRGNVLIRNWTRVSCISGGLFTRWATREALVLTQSCPNRHFCERFLYSDLIMTIYILFTKCITLNEQNVHSKMC